MVKAYTLADLRRIEKRISEPLDLEREAWEAERFTFISKNGSVLRVPSGRGLDGPGSFTRPVPTDKIYGNAAAANAQASFSVETLINNTAGMGPQGNIPPYFFAADPISVGRAMRVVGRGIASTTGTPTYTFSFRLGASGTGGPLILGSAAITTGSSISNQLFEFEGDIQITVLAAAGANSTARGLGLVGSGGFASPFSYALFGGAASPGTVATFDISITNFFNFNMNCSASSASNSVQLLQLIVLGLD